MKNYLIGACVEFDKRDGDSCLRKWEPGVIVEFMMDLSKALIKDDAGRLYLIPIADIKVPKQSTVIPPPAPPGGH